MFFAVAEKTVDRTTFETIYKCMFLSNKLSFKEKVSVPIFDRISTCKLLFWWESPECISVREEGKGDAHIQLRLYVTHINCFVKYKMKKKVF